MSVIHLQLVSGRRSRQAGRVQDGRRQAGSYQWTT